MASLSESASSRGRRLCELLEERQEPFSLDAYLIDHGYSNRNNSNSSLSTKMSRPVSGLKRLRRMTSHSLSNWKSGGLLKCILTKVLHGRAIRKSLNWQLKPAEQTSISAYTKPNCFEVDEMSCGRSISDDSYSCEQSYWDYMEMVEESKHFSPVSVLGLQSYDSSLSDDNLSEEENVPISGQELQTEALDIFKQLFRAPRVSAFDRVLKSKVDFDQIERFSLDGESDCSSTDAKPEDLNESGSISIEKQREILNSIEELVCSEISNLVNVSDQPKPELAEIADQIETAIFDDLQQELVLEISGGFL